MSARYCGGTAFCRRPGRTRRARVARRDGRDVSALGGGAELLARVAPLESGGALLDPAQPLLEVLVGRAVVAPRKRRALAWRALARVRSALARLAVEGGTS